MKEDGVKPSHYTFVALLKACGSIANLEKVRTLHIDAHEMGLSADAYISTTLVNVYGKCGSIVEAEKVFGALPRHDIVTWNAMLTAYVEQGLPVMALKLFRQIQHEKVSLDELMFVSALQACTMLAEKEGGLGKVMALEIGKSLHSNARRAGFCSGPFILTTLVNMYNKSGSIIDAEGLVSATWSHCNNVTLNAMIAAYFEHNQEKKSLQLYKYLQEEGLNIDEYTFASALQACGALAEKEGVLELDGDQMKVVSLELGKAMHLDAQRWNVLSDIFVCNTFIRIYGKCGAISDAEGLFCRLVHRDVVSWNSLMSSYIEHGQAEKALLLYKQMGEETVSPVQLTLVMALQACGQLAERDNTAVLDIEKFKSMSLEIGLGLLADAQDQNFTTDIVVGDSLLRMYSKCGAIVHAEDLFSVLRSHLDVRFWTSMILAYAELGYEENALRLYVQMSKEGINPDQHSFVVAIHACGMLAEKEEVISLNGQFVKARSLEIGIALHADAWRQCYYSDKYINNTLVSMYGKCGAVTKAENLFSQMVHRDEVSWNALLSAYSDSGGQGEKVLQLYNEMQAERCDADQVTFVIALQACSDLLEEEHHKKYPLEIGEALCFDAQKKGLSSDLMINNSLLSMYGKHGNVPEAEALFDAMHLRDGVSWAVLLSMYVEQGHVEMVLELYSQMQVENVFLDNVLLIYILRACIIMGSLEVCRENHFVMSSHGFDLTHCSLVVSLIHTYGNCASPADAEAVFDGLLEPDIASWNSCIASYAGEGDCQATMHALEELCMAGKKPNEVSFASALNACAHAGLAVLALENFSYMTKECSLIPTLMHYSAFIDLLGRVGSFNKVENVLKKMLIQPDVTMWTTLLGCCRQHGNVEVGEQAFKNAVKLQPAHSAAYIMLSNLYIEAGVLNCKSPNEVIF